MTFLRQRRGRGWLIGLAITPFLYLHYNRAANHQLQGDIDAASTTGGSDGTSSTALLLKTRQLEPDWDSTGSELYRKQAHLVSSLVISPTRNVTFNYPNPDGVDIQPIFVSHDRWWNQIENSAWERGTFRIFNKYITPGSTTVVDFGTWIGPTLLYHGQFSKRSYGIEADPVAFATVQHNVRLNANATSWGGRVSVDSGCVSRPEDVGILTMRAGKAPGASMSGLGKVAQDRGARSVTWNVRCYTLKDIFENYWRIPKPYEDVFVKIDVESYECKLIPSFYDWLKEERFLPKMFISFHPQIEACSEEEFEGVLRFLRLYDHVRVGNDSRELNVTEIEATDLRSQMHDVVVYQKHHIVRS